MKIHGITVLLVLLLLGSAGQAQTYPRKPIRIVVPLAAGGPTDSLARTIAVHLSDKWGQPVVVDNRPGANTNIGTDLVAKAPADGYTLLLTVNNLTINPSIYPKLPFDPLRDFAPISLFATSPLVLVVNPSVPAKSVQELIALAKARPGQLQFGSPGNGSPPHLAAEMFSTLAHVKMFHVPYKEITQATSDLMGGQIDLMFPGSPIALPQVRSGKLRALATTGAKRTPAAPDLPTVAEAGLPDFEVSLWYGLLAPAKTPPAIVQQLQSELARMEALPSVVQQWAGLGVEPVHTTPQEFAAYLKRDLEKWQKVVRDSGAKID
ncbi:MAG: tripartite tricarboxylate transporter substrate binding protein [Pseudomonadota bacterium]